MHFSQSAELVPACGVLGFSDDFFTSKKYSLNVKEVSSPIWLKKGKLLGTTGFLVGECRGPRDKKGC